MSRLLVRAIDWRMSAEFVDSSSACRVCVFDRDVALVADAEVEDDDISSTMPVFLAEFVFITRYCCCDCICTCM